MKRKNRKDALIIVPRSVTLSIVPSQWACFLAEVTNRGNEQTANMQQRTEVIRRASFSTEAGESNRTLAGSDGDKASGNHGRVGRKVVLPPGVVDRQQQQKITTDHLGSPKKHRGKY